MVENYMQNDRIKKLWYLDCIIFERVYFRSSKALLYIFKNLILKGVILLAKGIFIIFFFMEKTFNFQSPWVGSQAVNIMVALTPTHRNTYIDCCICHFLI
jgi:hypothetical protein